MPDYYVEVMLQFPGMPKPYQVRLSPHDVHYLDRHATWRFAPDGTVIYDMTDRPTEPNLQHPAETKTSAMAA
jgi:hypothetical protein